MVKYGLHNRPNFFVFIYHITSVFQSGIFSNSGLKVPLLESKLEEFFSLSKIDLVNNGTVAIELALRALVLEKSESKYVITTPFTHPSTVIAIQNTGLIPVYVDIDEEYFCLDPKKVEDFLDNTQIPLREILCILPVHVMNNLCDLESFDDISRRFQLPLIYDAAHSVGTTYKGKAALGWGTFSCASLHATKALSTGEGGLVVSNSSDYGNIIHLLKNFGISPEGSIIFKGINGKLSEFSACYGLASLANFTKIKNKKKKIYKKYMKKFESTFLHTVKIRDSVEPNYNYFPILLRNDQEVKNVVKELSKKGIGFRRYFSPSLDTTQQYFGNTCITSRDIASRILILPTNYNLKTKDIEKMVKIIKEVVN